MQPRTSRHAAPRAPIAPIHRGPQAQPQSQQYGGVFHAPNAALLIDFDNVTMGIRSDLAAELRSLLGSEIIKGKVAVQRAYADWRRYPQYIVPLAESSIDMIMAPAYGSSKKNATDIRLSVDAMELVFTRPEIGTYILLSGDSDFASLVTKLKEYGKYVIGVGIRESSSDLLVMNCDEYYSYNALAGLVKSGDEEVTKWDPWELVVEAITRMQKNGDVMRSDRLKQVMQDIDATFDEKNVGHGYSKFSKFVSDAAEKGLVKITKLENGQLEVSPAEGAVPMPHSAEARQVAAPDGSLREDRGRRGRRGRGRDRDRERPDRNGDRPLPGSATPAPAVTAEVAAAPPRERAPHRPAPSDGIGVSGERLTRQEAFDLVKRSTAAVAKGDEAALSADVRRQAFDLLGRDSESLGERNFHRILRDAHDAEVIDLRRRGDDYEVSLPAAVGTVVDQLNQAEAAHTAAAAPAAASQPPVRGMGRRGGMQRGSRPGAAPPPNLFMVGVVDHGAPLAAVEVQVPESRTADAEAAPAAAKPRSGGARKTARAKAEKAPKVAKKAAASEGGTAAKRPRRPRAKAAAKKAAAPVS